KSQKAFWVFNGVLLNHLSYTPYGVSTGLLPDSTSITIFGFGEDANNPGGSDDRQRSGTVRTGNPAGINAEQCDTDDSVKGPPKEWLYSAAPAATEDGDSGGPLIYGGKVYGVHNWRNYFLMKGMGGTSTAAYKPWVDRMLKHFCKPYGTVWVTNSFQGS